MKTINRADRNTTIYMALVLALYHFTLIVLFSDKVAIVWFELPFLVLTIFLSLIKRVKATLALCYSIVCMSLLAEPTVGMSYLTWFVLVPYFFVLENERRLAVLAGWGLWTGMFVASGIYSWIWRAMTVFFELHIVIALSLFILIIFLVGVQHAIFLWLAGFFRNRLGKSLTLIVPPLYTIVEFWMPLPMPIALGLGFVSMPFFLQPLDVIGVYGVSLLIAIVSSGIYFIYKGIRQRNGCMLRGGLALVAISLAIHVGYSLWAFSYYRDDPESPSIDIAMIQPLAPLKIKNTDVELQENIAWDLKRLSLQAISGRESAPDLLLWPEGAGPFASKTPEFNSPYMNAIVDIQTETSTTLIVQDIEFTREARSGKIQYYSTMSLIEPVGHTVDVYRKNILMPFSEYLPFERQFPMLRKFLPQARSILKGETPEPLEGPGGPIAPLICYEVMFPNYVRRLVAQGCRYIINLTNDRWYGVRQQPTQHQCITALRAIENRRPVARSTNSGISAFIDARGVIEPERQTQIMKQAILRGKIYPRSGNTFYTVHGDIMHRWIFTPLYIILFLYCLIYSGPRLKQRMGKERNTLLKPNRKR